MSVLLFVKGDRGLVANENGRFIFPDRKSSIKKEGLYDCRVTIDKGKYAFVTGKAVETVMPSDEYVKAMILKELSGIDVFSIKKIGSSIILYRKKYARCEIGYIDSHDVYHCILSYMGNLREHNRNIANLYMMNPFQEAIDYAELRKSTINKLATKLNDAMLKNVATVALVKFIKSNPYIHGLSITLVDNRYILIETDSYCTKRTNAYIYNETNGVVEISDIVEECVDNTSTKKNISISEIINYAIENHLGARCFGKEETYTQPVSFMGDCIDVECLNGNLLFDDISDDSKAKAAESFKKLEDYTRKVGKKISKSSMHELINLAPRCVLGFKGVK